jgi:hypothetical protein|tara:strand:+ start:3394 stop:3747 length:354 start_codon:yes stop_codon:yes gene_type:complete
MKIIEKKSLGCSKYSFKSVSDLEKGDVIFAYKEKSGIRFCARRMVTFIKFKSFDTHNGKEVFKITAYDLSNSRRSNGYMNNKSYLFKKKNVIPVSMSMYGCKEFYIEKQKKVVKKMI